MKLRTSQSVTVCKTSLKATSLRLFCLVKIRIRFHLKNKIAIDLLKKQIL
mgnify:CR=1 FL=1